MVFMEDKYSLEVDSFKVVITEKSTGRRIFSMYLTEFFLGEVKIDKEICTSEFVDWAVNYCIRANQILAIPREMMTVEQRNTAYKNMKGISEKIKLISNGFMDGLITYDILEELLTCNDLKCIVVQSDVLKKINKDFWTLDFIDRVINKISDSRVLAIPREMLTREQRKNVYKNMKSIIDKALLFVNEFMDGLRTYDMYLELYNNYKYLSGLIYSIETIFRRELKDKYAKKTDIEFPSDEYDFKTWCYLQSIERGISIDTVIKKYYEKQVAKNPRSFTTIPDKYKTYNMCSKVVIKYPKFITKVPAHMIDFPFLMNIERSGVIIPKSALVYVQECIRANYKPVNLDALHKIQPVKMEKEIANISINSLSSYFSRDALNYLREKNIKTFEQLCNYVNHPEKILEYKNNNIRQEIIGTTKILKCKYLNEDPLININDDGTYVYEISNTFGLSYDDERSLFWAADFYEWNVKEFFDIVGTSKFEEYENNHYYGKENHYDGFGYYD